MSEDLGQLRQQIDDVDLELQRLMNQRAGLAQRVAQAKAASGADLGADCYRPCREADVLRAVKERNQGPLPAESVARLFREIMSACLALESPLRVAYLGPAGTFTEAAAVKHFGHAVTTASVPAIDEVFREVEAGSANYGVVPVENSTEGVVTHTLDSFIHSPLTICGEVRLRVHHNLLSNAGQLTAVKRVYAHSQALAQCRKWLEAELPQAERIAVSSNAEGAKQALADDEAAAIASEQAASVYRLATLATRIEDEPDNTTRFLVVGKQAVARSGSKPEHNVTSVLLSMPNKAGALHDMLKPLAEHGVSMNRIESRPSRREAWDYVFFIDLQGHIEEPQVKAAIDAIAQQAPLCKVLGSYPAAVL